MLERITFRRKLRFDGLLLPLKWRDMLIFFLDVQILAHVENMVDAIIGPDTHYRTAPLLVMHVRRLLLHDGSPSALIGAPLIQIFLLALLRPASRPFLVFDSFVGPGRRILLLKTREERFAAFMILSNRSFLGVVFLLFSSVPSFWNLQIILRASTLRVRILSIGPIRRYLNALDLLSFGTHLLGFFFVHLDCVEILFAFVMVLG